jgi:hypothetical protein
LLLQFLSSKSDSKDNQLQEQEKRGLLKDNDDCDDVATKMLQEVSSITLVQNTNSKQATLIGNGKR